MYTCAPRPLDSHRMVLAAKLLIGQSHLSSQSPTMEVMQNGLFQDHLVWVSWLSTTLPYVNRSPTPGHPLEVLDSLVSVCFC